MKQLIIVKTGSKIPSLAGVAGDYGEWIARGLGETGYPLAIIDVARGEPLPDRSTVAAIVITGSTAMVTERATWMEQGAAWLRGAVAAEVPLLGICFGHQLLAWALGGEVGYNPRGLEVGTATIRLTDEAQQDPLFRGMPATLPAQVSHRQSVLRLPAGARLLAASDKEPHQAFAVGACAWGVQFHPEFDAPIIRYFIEYYRERLLEEGDEAERLLGTVRDSPHSASLLGRFARLVLEAGRE